MKTEPPKEGLDRIFLVNRGWAGGRIHETLTKKPVETSGPATQKGLNSSLKIPRGKLISQ